MMYQSNWVNIWSVNLNEVNTNKAQMINELSADENLRFNKFLISDDALRYTKVHYTTKNILSNYINKNEIIIKRDFNGKPILSNSNSNNIYFNISYRKNLLLVAISNQEQIGIDVEQISELMYVEDLINSCFTKKEKKLIFNCQNKNNQIEKICQLWTLKEAYVKALGIGLTKPMNSFEVCDFNNMNKNNKTKSFTLQPIHLKNNLEYRAAFAVKAANIQTKYYDYEEA